MNMLENNWSSVLYRKSETHKTTQQPQGVSVPGGQGVNARVMINVGEQLCEQCGG